MAYIIIYSWINSDNFIEEASVNLNNLILLLNKYPIKIKNKIIPIIPVSHITCRYELWTWISSARFAYAKSWYFSQPIPKTGLLINENAIELIHGTVQFEPHKYYVADIN